MGFFKNILRNAKYNAKDFPTGGPLEGKEDKIHVKRIENYTEGNKYVWFHFPDFEKEWFSLEIIENEFEGKSIILPSSVHGSQGGAMLLGTSHVFFSIKFQLEKEIKNKDNYKCFISFITLRKELPIGIGDIVSLLLDNGEILKFIIEEKGVRYDKSSEGIEVKSNVPIAIDVLKKLGKVSVKKWHYEESKTGKTINSKQLTATDSFQSRSKIQKMAVMFYYAIVKL